MINVGYDSALCRRALLRLSVELKKEALIYQKRRKHHANDEHVCILERASANSMVLAEWQTDWANGG